MIYCLLLPQQFLAYGQVPVNQGAPQLSADQLQIAEENGIDTNIGAQQTELEDTQSSQQQARVEEIMGPAKECSAGAVSEVTNADGTVSYVFDRQSQKNIGLVINLVMAAFAGYSSTIKILPPNGCVPFAPSYYMNHGAIIAQSLMTVMNVVGGDKKSKAITEEFKAYFDTDEAKMDAQIAAFDFAAKQTEEAYKSAKKEENIKKTLGLIKDLAIVAAIGETIIQAMPVPGLPLFACGAPAVIAAKAAQAAGTVAADSTAPGSGPNGEGTAADNLRTQLQTESVEGPNGEMVRPESVTYKGYEVTLKDGNLNFASPAVDGTGASVEIDTFSTVIDGDRVPVDYYSVRAFAPNPTGEGTVTSSYYDIENGVDGNGGKLPWEGIDDASLQREMLTLTDPPPPTPPSPEEIQASMDRTQVYIAGMTGTGETPGQDGTLEEIVVTGTKIQNQTDLDIAAAAAMGMLKGFAANLIAQMILQSVLEEVFGLGMEVTPMGRSIWYTTQKLIAMALSGGVKKEANCLKTRAEEYRQKANDLRTRMSGNGMNIAGGGSGTSNNGFDAGDFAGGGPNAPGPGGGFVEIDPFDLGDFKGCMVQTDGSFKYDSDCSCKSANGCYKPPALSGKKITEAFGNVGLTLPSAVSTSTDAANRIISSTANGTIGSGEARLAAQTLANNAFKVGEFRKKAEKFANKQIKKNGGDPKDIEAEAKKLHKRIHNRATRALAKAGLINPDGTLNFSKAGISTAKAKEEKSNFTKLEGSTAGTTSLGSKRNRGGSNNNSFNFMDDSKTTDKNSNFDLSDNNVDALKEMKIDDVKNLRGSTENIFNIISARYMRSGYPRLFNKKAKKE